jgi:hypothetical protein
VWANFGRDAVRCDGGRGWAVDVCSTGPGTDGRPWDGELGAHEAVVARPG